MPPNGKRKCNQLIKEKAVQFTGTLPIAPGVKFDVSRVDFASFFYNDAVFAKDVEARAMRVRLAFCPLHDPATVSAIDAVSSSMAMKIFDMVRKAPGFSLRFANRI